MVEFGEYIRAQRKTRGWTLDQAATNMGVSPNRLAEIERGRSYRTDNPSRPSRELIYRMASTFDLPVSSLLALAGYPVEETESLSADARQALALYESLSPEHKHLALGVLRLFASSRNGRSGESTGADA